MMKGMSGMANHLFGLFLVIFHLTFAKLDVGPLNSAHEIASIIESDIIGSNIASALRSFAKVAQDAQLQSWWDVSEPVC